MRVRSADEIKANLREGFNRAGVTNYNPGGVAATLLEHLGNQIAAIHAFGVECVKQGYATTATGAFLDAKVAEHGLTRAPGRKARRKVRLVRRATSGAVSIPAGRIVQTKRGADGKRFRFVMVSNATMPDRAATLDVVVEAEAAGAVYNLPANTVTEFGSTIAGLSHIEDNLPDAIQSEGADAESDARLRRRYLLAWDQLTTGSTAAAYLSWCLSDPRVAQAWIDYGGPRGEGTINIHVASVAPTLAPSDDLLAALNKLIIGTGPDYRDGKRPYGDNVQISGPQLRDVDIELVLYRHAGVDAGALELEIRRLLAAYFSPQEEPIVGWLRPIGISREVVHSQLIEICARPDGVYKVVLTNPAGDVPMNPGELARLGTVTIRHEEVVV